LRALCNFDACAKGHGKGKGAVWLGSRSVFTDRREGKKKRGERGKSLGILSSAIKCLGGPAYQPPFFQTEGRGKKEHPL